MRLRLLVRRVTLTGTAWAAALAVAVLVCAVGAAAAHSASGPACMHDAIAAKQLGSRTLDEALAEGRFRAHGIVEVPRAGLNGAATTDDNWRPLRIAVYAEDLKDPTKYCNDSGEVRSDFLGRRVTCTDFDIVTPETADLLLNTMLPQAIKMHQDRLSVQPLANITIGNSMLGEVCREFTVPAELQANGVRDADFVLFVAAVPITGSLAAWSDTCGYGDDNRPLIGITNIRPEHIDGSERSIRLLAHEIMHALGFHEQLFRIRGIMLTTSALRGGPDAPVIASDQVVQRTGNHYNCSALPGMELDRTGGPATALSHWNVRNAKDEMMCGYIGPAMKYTAISIAAMEDLGYYRGNYSSAEHMEWGFNAGCVLLDEKCVKEDVSQVPSMFCGLDVMNEEAALCHSTRSFFNYCRYRSYRRDLPPYFQYFTDPRIGGTALSDYCPYVDGPAVHSCLHGMSDLMELSLPGPQSRCVDLAKGTNLTYPLCVNITCDSSAQTYNVTFLNATSSIECPQGTTIDAASSSPETFNPGSTIICPPYGSVCPALFNSLAIRVNRTIIPPTTTTAPSPANTTTQPVNPGDGSARLCTAFLGATGAVMLTLAALAL